MTLKPLPADANELLTAAATVLPSCPFCGYHAVMTSSVNETPAFRSSPIFQTKIPACVARHFRETRQAASRPSANAWKAGRVGPQQTERNSTREQRREINRLAYHVRQRERCCALLGEAEVFAPPQPVWQDHRGQTDAGCFTVDQRVRSLQEGTSRASGLKGRQYE